MARTRLLRMGGGDGADAEMVANMGSQIVNDLRHEHWAAALAVADDINKRLCNNNPHVLDLKLR